MVVWTNGSRTNILRDKSPSYPLVVLQVFRHAEGLPQRMNPPRAKHGIMSVVEDVQGAKRLPQELHRQVMDLGSPLNALFLLGMRRSEVAQTSKQTTCPKNRGGREEGLARSLLSITPTRNKFHYHEVQRNLQRRNYLPKFEVIWNHFEAQRQRQKVRGSRLILQPQNLSSRVPWTNMDGCWKTVQNPREMHFKK